MGLQALSRLARRAPRWVYVVTAGLLAVVALGALSSAISAGPSSGDPGGHILNELQPVGYAVPRDVQIIYRHEDEPHWDSCDARPGTFGWNQVVVQIHFRSRSAPADVESNADAQLRRLGWQSAYQYSAPTIAWGWTKQLRNVTEAKAQLEVEADGAWTLIALAPPVGPRAHGC